jgi:hypothetical protein
VNFAAPALLWALPLVAVPIIIHLLKRRRPFVVDFGATDFLRRALRRTRRRVILEDLLLLVLRTLAVLFLVLALARPSTGDLPLPGARAQRNEVVVLDASLSMRHLAGGDSTWDRARGLARERLRDLDGAEGDRAALVLAGLTAERAAAGDPGEVRAVLEESEQAGAGRAALSDALRVAATTANSLPEAAGKPVRVTVLTDLQRSGWPLDGDWAAPIRELLAAGHGVEVIDCGASGRDNVSVSALSLSSPAIVLGDACDVTATLHNHGTTRAELDVVLLLDGDEIARERLVLAGGEETTWNVPLSPIGLGARGIEVRIDHDGLVDDDARAAVLTVEETLRVAVAGEYAPAGEPDGMFDALLRYLDLGEQAPLRAELVPAARLDATTLEAADVLVLADAGRLGRTAAQAVADFCATGGGLLVLTGPETGPDELTPLFEALGITDLEVGRPVRATGDFARLQLREPEHPALSFFLDPRWQPLLTEVPFARYRPLRVADGAEGVRMPLGYVEEDTTLDAGGALALWPQGGGRAALLSAAPCATWNRMDEVPGGTLPLLFDLLFHLAPEPGYPVQSEVGAPLQVVLPRPPVDSELRDPDGLRYSTFAGSDTLEGGRTRLRLLERARRPGLWNFRTHLLMPDGGELRQDLRLAVVVPADESDLRRVDRTAFRDVLPEGARLASFDDAGGGDGAAPEQDRSLVRLLLQLLLAFLVAETLMGAWLDSRRRA